MAASIIARFAEAHGWAQSLPDFGEMEVLVAPDQAALRRYLQDIGELVGDGPAGLIAAALPGSVLISAAAGIKRVRPEYLRLKQGWTRLLAHEFAHLLHLNLVGGESDRLGPRWFFEGFACFAAGQYLGKDFRDEPVSQILDAVKTDGRKQYPIYEAAVRFLADKHSLQSMVERAASPDFEAWLLTETAERAPRHP